MHRKLVPTLLAVLSVVGIPMFAAAGAASPASDACPPTTAPTTEPTSTGAAAPDGELADEDVSADWQSRCDIDPETYYLGYASPDYDSATTTGTPLPSPGVPATTGQTVLAESRVDAADATATGGAPEYQAPQSPTGPEPGPLDDNTFVDAGQSQWVNVRDDRESTFSLDVDTGSFSVAEQFAAMGYQPEPESVRPEEWVNSFEYGDVNTGPDALAVNVENAPAVGNDPVLMRIGVSTEELAAEDRPPANITFVIDTSGSMDIRERLGLVKASLALLTRNLRADDTVAIVTYGDDASPLLYPTPVEDWRSIVDAIDSLEPGGSTNMEAGLRLGYDLARETYDPEALNVVVLASDGVANAGVTDGDVLTQEITRAGEQGISLVTVGFGMGNYNDYLMEQLANQGDGFYSYVDTYGQAVELFVDDLTPTLTVVAKDAKVQVVFDDETVARYRLIGYENRALDDSDFTDDTVDAAEFGAGHHATAVYEVELLDDQPAGSTVEVGEVRVRWEDPNTGEITEVVTDVAVDADTEASPTLRFATLVAHSAEYFRGDGVIAERGVTIDELISEATELDAMGVDGAAEFGEYLRTAAEAQPIEPTVIIEDF